MPHLQAPSPLEATLTPEEAAIAAHIIHAEAVVPIHYASLNKAGAYVETLHPVERLQSKSREFQIRATTQEPGTWFDLE